MFDIPCQKCNKFIAGKNNNTKNIGSSKTVISHLNIWTSHIFILKSIP